jgi:hypothetical protein
MAEPHFVCVQVLVDSQGNLLEEPEHQKEHYRDQTTLGIQNAPLE